MISLLISGLLVFGHFVQEIKNPIDAQLDSCLAEVKNLSTTQIIRCEFQAEKKWNEEVNIYYDLLMTLLPEANKQRLIEAQKKWILFKESEFEFGSSLSNELGGENQKIGHVTNRRRFVQKRAFELMDYYDSIKND